MMLRVFCEERNNTVSTWKQEMNMRLLKISFILLAIATSTQIAFAVIPGGGGSSTDDTPTKPPVRGIKCPDGQIPVGGYCVDGGISFLN
jgi:hypothetical protein